MLYQELYGFVSTISELAQIFLILGIVFGVFAGLMLANFITVSISAKKKDIGILRAVGARGRDVFKIFFSEAGIISAICFVLATIGAGIASIILNNSLSKITTISLLNFGAVNILLILGVSLVVSLLATIFPVRSASKKSPVESIRSL
jgi:ABC-type antimicrobial peptide transport system permease subunit